MKMCISCFFLALFLLFVCFVLVWFACFYFILLLFFRCLIYFLMRDRKGMGCDWKEDRGNLGGVGRGRNCVQKILHEKHLFSIKEESNNIKYLHLSTDNSAST